MGPGRRTQSPLLGFSGNVIDGLGTILTWELPITTGKKSDLPKGGCIDHTNVQERGSSVLLGAVC